MTSTKYTESKRASEMWTGDQFYFGPVKYEVTHPPIEDNFERVLITFLEVDGDPDRFCDLAVHPDFQFLTLIGVDK